MLVIVVQYHWENNILESVQRVQTKQKPHCNTKYILIGHLLARVGRQVEDKDSEERDAHTGDDEVHCVEERLAAHRQVECYICKIM